MPNGNNENDDSSNDGANGAAENQDDKDLASPSANDEDATEDIDELKEKLQKQQEQNQRLFERAKKAEGFEKQPDGSWVKVQKKPEPKSEPAAPQPQSGELSVRDAMALQNADVTEDEDIEKVMKFAKLEGITIKEALGHNVMRSLLNDSAEKRKTASATNTGRTRTGTTKGTGEALLEKARKSGELPDSNDEMTKLAEQHWNDK